MVVKEFAQIAQLYPLPRTIFLLAREPEIFALREALGSMNFGPLGLSDNPPKVIPVLGSNVPGDIRQASARPADVVLLFMTLYHQNRRNAQ